MPEETSRASGRMTEAAGKGLSELSELAGNLREDAAAKNRLYGILGALPGKEGIMLQMLCMNESGPEQEEEALRKAENGGKEVYRALEDFHLMCSPAEEGRLSRMRRCFVWNRFIRGEMRGKRLKKPEAEEWIRRKTGYSLKQAGRYAKLQRLVPEWRNEWRDGRISLGAAVELASLSTGAQQLVWLTLVSSGSVSIGEREVRRIRGLASRGNLSEAALRRELGR